MEHSLWVIGDNRIVALSEIRNVSPKKDGAVVFFKDGSKEDISSDEVGNLVKAIMMTQKNGGQNSHGWKGNYKASSKKMRDWS